MEGGDECEGASDSKAIIQETLTDLLSEHSRMDQALCGSALYCRQPPEGKMGFGFRQRRSGFSSSVFRRPCPEIKKSPGEEDKTLVLVFEKLAHSVTARFLFFFVLFFAFGAGVITFCL